MAREVIGKWLDEIPSIWTKLTMSYKGFIWNRHWYTWIVKLICQGHVRLSAKSPKWPVSRCGRSYEKNGPSGWVMWRNWLNDHWRSYDALNVTGLETKVIIGRSKVKVRKWQRKCVFGNLRPFHFWKSN
jgi:hypothetical protein